MHGGPTTTPTVGRLRGRAAFEELRKTGVRRRSGPLLVAWAPSDSSPAVGFAVGRAVGTAVARNRLRRRLRAIVSSRAGRLAGGSYLFSVRPEASDLTFQDLERLVDDVLRGLPTPSARREA